MKRRTFLQSLGTTTALLPVGGSVLAVEPGTDEHELIKIFVAQNDGRISQIIGSQLTETDSNFVGGFPDQYDICRIGQVAWNVVHLMAGFVSPDSAFFRSDEVAERLNLAMDFVRRMQHEDGTVDLVTTNFHSPPDTAFVVEPIALALSSARRWPEGLDRFHQLAEAFLTKAGQALARGGIHTPNHRWVVCMALARIHEFMPDPNLVKRVDAWLAEGIDIDADGQYTERSTSTYTPLVNRCLITVARLLQRPELYDPVRKNLELTRYLVRPNGELVTEVSRRQDQYRQSLADKYYYPYHYLACLDGNGCFAVMTRFIEKTVGRENLFQQLFYYLEDPSALAPLPPSSALPDKFEKHFPNTQIVRIRRGRVDASIIAENSTLFTFHKGRAVLQSLRLASAFFGKGQFAAPDVHKRSGGYVLTQRLVGAYLQPLPDDLLPGDGDWSKMPHELREKSEVQELISTVTFCESEGRFRIHFHIDGTDHVPWAIELGFRPGGQLSGVRPIQCAKDSYLAGKSGGRYCVGDDVIHFSTGPTQHAWTQLRGALPKLDAQRVYYTGFTPVDFELTIS